MKETSTGCEQWAKWTRPKSNKLVFYAKCGQNNKPRITSENEMTKLAMCDLKSQYGEMEEEEEEGKRWVLGWSRWYKKMCCREAQLIKKLSGHLRDHFEQPKNRVTPRKIEWWRLVVSTKRTIQCIICGSDVFRYSERRERGRGGGKMKFLNLKSMWFVIAFGHRFSIKCTFRLLIAFRCFLLFRVTHVVECN